MRLPRNRPKTAKRSGKTATVRRSGRTPKTVALTAVFAVLTILLMPAAFGEEAGSEERTDADLIWSLVQATDSVSANLAEIDRALLNASLALSDDGITQQELAARLGCTQAALSNYELGKRRLYLANLERIASALGKPLSYFTEPASDEDDTQIWDRYPHR